MELPERQPRYPGEGMGGSGHGERDDNGGGDLGFSPIHRLEICV